MIAYSIIGGDRNEYGPVDGEQVRRWFMEGRANGATLIRSGEGAWRPLSEHSDFKDLFCSAPPPLGETGAAAIPWAQPTSMVELESTAEAKGAVLGPAAALIILALIDGILAVLQLISGLVGGVAGWMGIGPAGIQFGPGELHMEEITEWMAGPVGLAGSVISLILSGVILVGGLRMLGLRNYGFCVVVSILAVIPCTTPCCCFGMAAGIWSLIVLFRPEVKAAFM